MAEIQNLRSRIEQAAVDLRNLGATEKAKSLLKAITPAAQPGRTARAAINRSVRERSPRVPGPTDACRRSSSADSGAWRTAAPGTGPSRSGVAGYVRVRLGVECPLEGEQGFNCNLTFAWPGFDPPPFHGNPLRCSQVRRWETRPGPALSARARVAATGAVAQGCVSSRNGD